MKVMQENLLKVNTGAALHINCQGDGEELIVFLHAVGGNADSWKPQLECFGDRYTCIAFDFRGHSRSQLSECHADARTVSVDEFARDTIALIEESGYSRAHLVGLSMGGVVALKTWSLRPDLIQSLCIANSWAKHLEGQAKIAFMKERLTKMTMQDSAAELIPDLFGPGAASSFVEETVAIEGSKEKEVFLLSWCSMFEADLLDRVSEIDVPVLLIGGSLDKVTPADPLLTSIKAELPLAQLKEIEGGGHFSNLDSIESFNNLLSVHLRRARARGGTRTQPPRSESHVIEGELVAHGLVHLLNERKIDYFFSNSGTDFTPIIDGFARYKNDADFKLEPVVAPHENTAIAMAHGYYLLTGRTQVVMGHVNVGTANMGLGIINASRSHIPVLVLSGNTPWYDGGVDGCRTNFVQWGQDTFDQGAYFREFTKWDYQLKGPHHMETVVDRAFAIAESDPAGPVYLTLPKEALCMKLAEEDKVSATTPCQRSTYMGAPAPDAVAQAARLIAESKKPLIITAEAGRYPGAVEALLRLASTYAIPVIEHGKRNFFNFPTESPYHLGFDPSPYVEEADLVIALESHVPWIPALAEVKQPPRMIHIGVDPLCSKLPMRAFPSDLSLTASPDLALVAIRKALSCLSASERYGKAAFFSDMEGRRSELKKEHDRLFGTKRSAASKLASGKEITKEFLSYTLGTVVDDEVVIFNEYNLDPYLVPRHLVDSWFENSVASGLGWSLGAALGAQLASPSQTMVVTLGDGSYLFNTPLSAHYVASAYKLPVVIVVFNDNAWSTIKKSYKGSMPGGWGLKNDYMPLCDFEVPVEFDLLAKATGGVGLKVEEPAELEATLKEALKISREERKHVLVNVVCRRDG